MEVSYGRGNPVGVAGRVDAANGIAFAAALGNRGTSLIKNSPLLEPFTGTIPRVL